MDEFFDALEGVPIRIEGWLMICEAAVRLVHEGAGSAGATVPVAWRPGYVVVRQDEQSLISYKSEQASSRAGRLLPRLRLDGGFRAFHRHFGLPYDPSYADYIDRARASDAGGSWEVKEGSVGSEEEDSLHVVEEEMSVSAASALPLHVQAGRFGTFHGRGSRPPRGADTSYDLVSSSAYAGHRGSGGTTESLDRRAWAGRGPGRPLPGDIGPGLCTTDSTPSTPQRLASFLSRPFRYNPLKRTKSVSKLERSKRLDPDGPVRSPLSPLNGVGGQSPNAAIGQLYSRNPHVYSTPHGYGGPGSSNSIRAARSHESLLNYSTAATHAIDLGSGNVDLKVVHPSVLGQANCIQVQTKEGATKYFHCRTPAERDRWVESVRRTMQPNLDGVRRTENSLALWVLEAKGVAAKRRFFVELCLDSTLYARTSAKLRTDICFWGEHFEFSHLPDLHCVCLNLYREPDKKKKKDRSTLIGYVEIPVKELTSRHPVEKWYVVKGADSKSSKSLGPAAIRVKGKWASVAVLPLPAYSGLLHCLQTSYLPLALALEPAISVKAKEDFATSLVRVLQKRGQAQELLTELVMAEVDALDNEHLMFRGNSLATKAMEAYMKLVGDAYLQETLGEFVRAVLDSNDDCEVDPLKLGGGQLGQLERHQKLLTFYVEMAWGKLINSFAALPAELRGVFAALRSRLAAVGRPELADNVISSSLFLRFFCPAILSPSLFGLVSEYPSGQGARNLTLIAKTVQTLANFSKFGGKEHYMEFMNTFVDKEWNNMKLYLHRISSPLPGNRPEFRWEGSIDCGKELSLLHSYLQESWLSLSPKAQADFAQLRKQLDLIADAVDDPQDPLNFAHPASPLSDYENNNRRLPAADLNTTDAYVSEDALADNLALRSLGFAVQERRQRPRNASRPTVTAKEAILGHGEALSFVDDPASVHGSMARGKEGSPVHKGSQLSIVGPSSGYNSLNHSSHSSSSASSSPVERAAQAPLSIANPLYSLAAVPLKASARSNCLSLPDIQAAAALSLPPVPSHVVVGSLQRSPDSSADDASPSPPRDWSLSQPAFDSPQSFFSPQSSKGQQSVMETPVGQTAPRTNPRFLAGRSPRSPPSAAGAPAPLVRRTRTDAGLPTTILNPHFGGPSAKARPVSQPVGSAEADGRKEAIIEAQQRKIDSLLSANQRLLSSLAHLKEQFGAQQPQSPSESSFESAASSPDLGPALVRSLY